MTALRLVGEAWALAATLQFVLWLVQLRTKNAAIVDVGWAGSFTLIIALFAWRTHQPASGWALQAALVVAWSVRLTGYLVSRGAATGVEEGRYVELRRKWAPHAASRFAIFFQAQAALAALLSAAFVMAFAVGVQHPGWLYVGAGITVIGIVGEAVADAQLARFKRAAGSRGKVCEAGLWSWSRHPNYFFEWCVWVGHAVTGFAFGGWGLIAIVPQAVILASIFAVTGIPPTEKQALRSKGDAYRAYQARVSKFIPWPPKPPSPAA